MSIFVKNGNIFRVASEEQLDIHQMLPAGNFLVKFNQDSGEYYLEQVASYQYPAKIYGNSLSQAERIIGTFMDRPKQTGVLLEGKKGSGKTMIARIVSSFLEEHHQIPTITVNSPYCNSVFKQFIADITQPCVVVFDEFEKVYNREQQEQMLTLLDGTVQTKKLFIITCNSKYKLDNNLINRPGRIFYAFNYNGLDDEFVKQYCADTLTHKEKVDDILKVKQLFDSFSFDMLQALVEELNRYNESASEALKVLNITPTDNNDIRFKIQVLNPAKIELRTSDTEFNGNPFDDDGVYVYLHGVNKKKLSPSENKLETALKFVDTTEPCDDEDEEEHNDGDRGRRVFMPCDISSCETGTIIFKDEDGYTLILTRQKASDFQYKYLF